MGCVNSCTIKLTLLAFGLRTSTQPTSTMRPEQTHVDLNRWRNDGKYRIRCTHVQGYFLLYDRHYFVSLLLALPSLLLFGGLKSATRGRWKCFLPTWKCFLSTDRQYHTAERTFDGQTHCGIVRMFGGQTRCGIQTSSVCNVTASVKQFCW